MENKDNSISDNNAGTNAKTSDGKISAVGNDSNSGSSNKAQTTMACNLLWQKILIEKVDEMVDAFLEFPPSVPKSFQDQQLARHLLWKILDRRSYFSRLFNQGAKPKDLVWLWERLFPYITGQYPGQISHDDEKLVRFSEEMFGIAKELVEKYGVNFDELMERIVMVVCEVREVQKDN